MAGKIFDYIQRRNKERLYKQWVESDGLSPNDVPQDIPGNKKGRLSRQSAKDISYSSEDIQSEEVSRIRPQDLSGGLVLVPTRYIWLAASIIATLLIALSVVVTILVMRLS